MGNIRIIENKIKLVTSVWGANLTVLHIPPKMFVYYNFRYKLDVSQNHKTKNEVQNCKLLTENKSQLINVVCDVQSGRTELTHTKTKNAWKEINM